MRGQTPYGLRGTALVLPGGTLANPSLRFSQERSGLYRVGSGVVGLSVQKFKALELSTLMTTVASNSPGVGPVTPLSLNRTNATTLNGQETSLEFRESNAPVSRMAVYRQSGAPFKYGFKWYGFSTTLHATPAMTLDGDKGLNVAGFVVARGGTPGYAMLGVHNDVANADAEISMITNATGTQQFGLLRLQGGPTAFGLGTAGQQGALSIYTAPGGPLILGTSGIARLTLNAAGSAAYRLGAGGAQSFTIQRSTDGAAIFTVTDAGLAASSIPAGSIPGSAIQSNTITAAQLAPSSVENDAFAGRVVGTEQIVFQAIHQQPRAYISQGIPAVDFDFAAGGWTTIPGATTGNFNPTSTHLWLALASISCSHSAGGRVILRVLNLQIDSTQTHLWQGSFDSGGGAGVIFAPTLAALLVPGSWLTSQFLLQAYSPDPGTVRVYAGLTNFQLWQVTR